jgi:alternative ribosome-rescue factor
MFRTPQPRDWTFFEQPRMMRAPAWGRSRRRNLMGKKSRSRPNKAKSLVAQPLFRCRQEQAKKGKGSYRREAFRSDDREAFVFLAA